MCYFAVKVNKSTGVEFQLLGFDAGAHLPPPVDNKDHPEKYLTGDYPS
jgi:hypothetical protein